MFEKKKKNEALPKEPKPRDVGDPPKAVPESLAGLKLPRYAKQRRDEAIQRAQKAARLKFDAQVSRALGSSEGAKKKK